MQHHQGFEYLAVSRQLWSSRSSSQAVFCKKVVLRNFVKFTGKHMCQSLFFNKVAGLRPATLLKKRLWRRCFPMNYAKFLGAPFFTEHPGGCLWSSKLTELDLWLSFNSLSVDIYKCLPIAFGKEPLLTEIGTTKLATVE